MKVITYYCCIGNKPDFNIDIEMASLLNKGDLIVVDGREFEVRRKRFIKNEGNISIEITLSD